MKSKRNSDCPGCDKLSELQSKTGLTEENISLFRMEMEKFQAMQEKINDRLISAIDKLRQQWTDDMKDVASKISSVMHKVTRAEMRIYFFMLTTLISALIAIGSRLIFK